MEGCTKEEDVNIWSCGLGENPNFAEEGALRHSVDTVYVGARDVLPDQARGAISWRYFNSSRRYMIHYVMGHSLWSKGGG